MAMGESGTKLTRQFMDEGMEMGKGVCSWPNCECEVGQMCPGSVASAVAHLGEHVAKLEVEVKGLHEVIHSRVPRGRL